MHTKLFLLILTMFVQPIFAQTSQSVIIKADTHTAADEQRNQEKIRKMLQAEANAPAAKFVRPEVLRFPLRIGIVTTQENPQYPSEEQLFRTVSRLNKGFQKAYIQFYIAQMDTIFYNFTLENLSDDGYRPYLDFSRQTDLRDTISLFLFDYNPNFCQSTSNSVSCGRQAGFSYILSEETNNIVLSKFDLEDHKIVAHEFGHFFGLHHTFEEKFGRESPNGDNCETAGDRICDTPADPGSVYEVYVNHSTCEMLNNFDEKTRTYFKPLIANYMAYYKPCYMHEYSFTQQQNKVMYLASRSEIRKHFADGQPKKKAETPENEAPKPTAED